MAFPEKLRVSERSERLELCMGNPTLNFVESGLFIKKLTVIATSVIAKTRRWIPDQCFDEHSFFGVDVPMLASDRDSKNGCAMFLQESVDEALEAFDRHYLKSMRISVYEDDKQTKQLLESITFNFKYKTEVQPNETLVAKDPKEQLADVRATTLALLEQLKDIERQEPALPPHYQIVVRLFYNKDTPPEYQPRGFVEDTAWRDDRLPNLPNWMVLGGVDTPYHRISVRKFYTSEAKAAIIAATQPPVDRSPLSSPTPSLPPTTSTSSRDVSS